MKQYLVFLAKTLPKYPTAVKGSYCLPKELDYAFNGGIEQKEEALQKIADHMGYFLGLLNSVKVRFIEKVEDGERNIIYINEKGGASIKTTPVKGTQYSGLYEAYGPGHKYITITNDRTYYLIHFLAVLAHEVTHNYLYHHNIRPPKNLDNEILTDLAAVYLGFGEILYKGYLPSNHIKNVLGYIDAQTIKKAMSLVRIRKSKICGPLIKFFE